jgi:hypothetical protein
MRMGSTAVVQIIVQRTVMKQRQRPVVWAGERPRDGGDVMVHGWAGSWPTYSAQHTIQPSQERPTSNPCCKESPVHLSARVLWNIIK